MMLSFMQSSLLALIVCLAILLKNNPLGLKIVAYAGISITVIFIALVINTTYLAKDLL